MDLSMSRTYICTNTRASHFLWRVATYISSTPFCGRASSMKNYVAHHDKRKVKPYERPRHISLSCTRKRSKHRITLIERKTSSTSTIMMSFLLFSFSSSSCISPSEWSTRSSRRDSIIAVLSQLYGRVHVTIVKRESPNDSRYYLAADNEVHYPNAAAGETGFVRHTTMANPGSTCTRIILAIHFALGRERGWPPKTVEDETKHIARKIEIRKARDKRARRKSLSSVQLGVFRETVFESRTLHAVVKMGADSTAGSTKFKVTSWSTGLSILLLVVCSRPLMRSWLCVSSLSLFLSFAGHPVAENGCCAAKETL